MTGFALMLVAAALAFGLSRLLRIPPIPLLMLSGAGLNWALHALHKDVPVDLITEMTEIGLAVLVFTAGIDLSPHRLRGGPSRSCWSGWYSFLPWGWPGYPPPCCWAMICSPPCIWAVRCRPVRPW